MNTLTQEQINDLLREHTCFHVWKSLSSGITSSMTREDVDDFANAAFALGVARGEKNSLSKCEILALDPYTEHTAADCVAAIRARK
jgi:hypothetical protein